MKFSSYIFSGTVVGLLAELVKVEADVSNGLPQTLIVGLPDTAVQESRQRVRAAIRNSGLAYPQSRVVVNLAPADLGKGGSRFDVGIALSILLAAGTFSANCSKKLFLGELSLSGAIRKVSGVLAIALAAEKSGIKEIFVPIENAREAALVQGLVVYGVASLEQLLEHLTGTYEISPTISSELNVTPPPAGLTDFENIAGHEAVKRGLEIAAAGMHNVLLYGPPGSGKTMLARSVPGLLPPLSRQEVLELTSIYSAAGKLHDPIVTSRPFRSPHHSSSHIALVGGGGVPQPGEITLAHHGVLFLDEFAEFRKHVLESLRQPLEDKQITLARARHTCTFPASFMMVAAMNPCPCGYYSDSQIMCSCSPGKISGYMSKISGPLLDRIDMCIPVARLEYNTVIQSTGAEKSALARSRIARCRSFQAARQGAGMLNSDIPPARLQKYCRLSESAQAMMGQAAERYYLSGRAVHRILRVARTIADLQASNHIDNNHLAEAIRYRLTGSSFAVTDQHTQ